MEEDNHTLNNIVSKEDILDRLNNVISAQGACKRIIVWNLRLLKDLKNCESWLRKEQEGCLKTK